MTVISEWQSAAPLVIAHRGASAYSPENTMAAFRLALQQGADAIELDAKLTKDGVVVVMHDDGLGRTTNAVGRIRDLNLNQVEKIDAGLKFSEEFVGEKIPMLYKVLESFGEEILINVELTNYASAWDDLPSRVIKLIEESGLESRVLIASFNPIALLKCRRISKEIPTALLIHAKSPRIYQSLLRSLLSYDLFHPQESLIDSKLVSDELRRGRKVTAWTINNENRMKELLVLGITGIITDVPDVAIRIRDEYTAAFDKSARESGR